MRREKFQPNLTSKLPPQLEVSVKLLFKLIGFRNHWNTPHQ
jgi:hypothetical protein